jgi:hypothetical protein
MAQESRRLEPAVHAKVGSAAVIVVGNLETGIQNVPKCKILPKQHIGQSWGALENPIVDQC